MRYVTGAKPLQVHDAPKRYYYRARAEPAALSLKLKLQPTWLIKIEHGLASDRQNPNHQNLSMN